MDDNGDTELVDVVVDRVDAVDGPATRMPFLILKAGNDQDPLAVLGEILKARYTADQQRKMLREGHAMRGPDGEPSYPIGDTEDLDDAIHAVGRGGTDHDKIRRFIARRARELGATGKIPEDWQEDGSIKKAEAMGDVHEALEALDDGEVTAADVVEDAAGIVAPTHEGDPDDVGSPAWEAVDAARARAAVAKVVWLKDLVANMQGRELAEATSDGGDPGDAMAAQDLGAVLDALDCALSVLAKFAVDEQAEADTRAKTITEQAAALGIIKALADQDLAEVIKAGRVLSSANEHALRAAYTALGEVLGRVPQPQPVEEEGAMPPVQKSEDAARAALDEASLAQTGPLTASPITKAAEGEPPTTTAPVAAEPVEKATGADALRRMALQLLRDLPDAEVAAAFQQLAKITASAATAGSDAPAGDTEPIEEAAPVDVAEEPLAVPAVAAPPMPETPEEDLQKSATTTTSAPTMDLKALTEAFAAAVTPLADRVSKAEQQAASVVDVMKEALTGALTPLIERLEKVECTPVPGPMLSGQFPGGPSLQTRGQDVGPGSDPVAEIRKRLSDIEDPNVRAAEAGNAAFQFMRAMDTIPSSWVGAQRPQ